MSIDEKGNDAAMNTGNDGAEVAEEKIEAGPEMDQQAEAVEQPQTEARNENVESNDADQQTAGIENKEAVGEPEKKFEETQPDKKGKIAGLSGLSRKSKKDETKDVLYFVGCTASFDINVKDVGINTVNILDALGIKFGVLGNDEKCCGSIALRIGDYTQFERLSTANIELFNSLGVKTFITSCSGCYKTVKHDYKKMGKLNMEVLHTCEFLARLIKENKIELKHEVPVRITYHDPCHMGRHSNVYDTPREVLKAIPGLEFVELERSGQYSRCCGAGGGLKAGYPDTQNLMSQERVRDAEEVKADWFVTTCPFCYQGLQIGINAIQSGLKMKDITEVVAIAMGIKPFEK